MERQYRAILASFFHPSPDLKEKDLRNLLKDFMTQLLNFTMAVQTLLSRYDEVADYKGQSPHTECTEQMKVRAHPVPLFLLTEMPITRLGVSLYKTSIQVSSKRCDGFGDLGLWI